MINREGDVRDANAFMSADRHRLMTSVGRRGQEERKLRSAASESEPRDLSLAARLLRAGEQRAAAPAVISAGVIFRATSGKVSALSLARSLANWP
jgi:hypothetical protein